MCVQEVSETLQRQGWSASSWYLERPHRHPAVFAVEKQLGPEVWMIVAVHREVDEFVVWSIMREGERLQLGEVEGGRPTIDKAVRLVQRVCKREDEEGDGLM
jgi:hypothetical protein